MSFVRQSFVRLNFLRLSLLGYRTGRWADEEEEEEEEGRMTISKNKKNTKKCGKRRLNRSQTFGEILDHLQKGRIGFRNKELKLIKLSNNFLRTLKRP